MNLKKRFGPLALAVPLLAQCVGVAPAGAPATYVPANAPSSVKNAAWCTPNRSGQRYVLVGSGGQGWWVVDSNGNYFGWLETQSSGCPNGAYLEHSVVYSRG